LSGLKDSEWAVLTDYHFQTLWELGDLVSSRKRKFMAHHFKLRYQGLMESQLRLNFANRQMKVSIPDTEIIARLKKVRMIPEDTDEKLRLTPDIFDSWPVLVDKTMNRWDQRMKDLVGADRTAEWREEMKAWGDLKSAVDAWSIHYKKYDEMMNEVDSLMREIDERRPRWGDFKEHGGASTRRQSSRLREKRQ